MLAARGRGGQGALPRFANARHRALGLALAAENVPRWYDSHRPSGSSIGGGHWLSASDQNGCTGIRNTFAPFAWTALNKARLKSLFAAILPGSGIIKP